MEQLHLLLGPGFFKTKPRRKAKQDCGLYLYFLVTSFHSSNRENSTGTGSTGSVLGRKAIKEQADPLSKPPFFLRLLENIRDYALETQSPQLTTYAGEDIPEKKKGSKGFIR